jgi:hypothetical protein
MEGIIEIFRGFRTGPEDGYQHSAISTQHSAILISGRFGSFGIGKIDSRRHVQPENRCGFIPFQLD